MCAFKVCVQVEVFVNADAAVVGCVLEMAAGVGTRPENVCAAVAHGMYDGKMVKAGFLSVDSLAKRDFAPATGIVKGGETRENALPKTGALYDSRAAKVNVTVKVNVFEKGVPFKEGVFEIRFCSKDGALKIVFASKARV